MAIEYKTLYDIPEDWKLLSEVDESEAYEVDISRVYKTSEGYILATASGCSCWEGEYEVQDFVSLDEIEKAVLFDRDGYTYNPSLEGAKTLVAEAKASDANIS